MLYTARRVLFVFAHPIKNEAACQKILQRYQDQIRRTVALGLAPEEYYLLVVTPHVPAYLQCTPEIQAYVKRYAEEDINQLSRIGADLGIPTERHYIAEGNCNWEALRLSKALAIDDVQGYTSGFLRFLTFREALKLRWRRYQSLKQSAFHALRAWRQPTATLTHTATEATSSVEASKRGGEDHVVPTHQKVGFLLNTSRDKFSTVASNHQAPI